jgi:hypothetical protein
MDHSRYSKLAGEANAAQAEVRAAFRLVADRKDEADPKTRRWLGAIEAFRAAQALVYPEALRQVEQGERHVSELDTLDMLDFLQADPVFHRSGYMKAKLLTELKRRKLDRHEAQRLQAIIVNAVGKPDRREFRHYCRAAAAVDDAGLRQKLRDLERADDAGTRRRATWVLTALGETDR